MGSSSNRAIRPILCWEDPQICFFYSPVAFYIHFYSLEFYNSKSLSDKKNCSSVICSQLLIGQNNSKRCLNNQTHVLYYAVSFREHIPQNRHCGSSVSFSVREQLNDFIVCFNFWKEVRSLPDLRCLIGRKAQQIAKIYRMYSVQDTFCSSEITASPKMFEYSLKTPKKKERYLCKN